MASRAENHANFDEAPSIAKRMSTHIAYALVAYTLLLIFEVSPQMEGRDMSIMPYFLLVVLVGLVIMPCRNLERRWQRLEAGDSANLDTTFRRDATVLWVGAIGFPTLLMTMIWVIP